MDRWDFEAKSNKIQTLFLQHPLAHSVHLTDFRTIHPPVHPKARKMFSSLDKNFGGVRFQLDGASVRLFWPAEGQNGFDKPKTRIQIKQNKSR